jgi:hypothetical protein
MTTDPLEGASMADDDFPPAPPPNYFHWADGIRDWLSQMPDAIAAQLGPQASIARPADFLPPDPTNQYLRHIGLDSGPDDPLERQQWAAQKINDAVVKPAVDPYVHAAQATYNFATTGQSGMTPEQEQHFFYNEALPTAATAFVPGLGGRIAQWLSRAATNEAAPLASELSSFASWSPSGFSAPPRPLRPFTTDFPVGGPSSGAPLARDIEGRPLTAPYVAGRRVAGGEDDVVQQSNFNALTQATTGKPVRYVPASQMPWAFGLTHVDKATDLPIGIDLQAGMPLDQEAVTHAHEIAHAIHAIAGKIPTDDLMDELKAVYNTLRNPKRTPNGLEADPLAKPVTPQSRGYTDAQAEREYLAEAIRAYMTNPNYLKTVAPKTAAAIRAAVNPNPTLSKIIQFNVVPLTAGGAAASYALKSPDDGS